MRPPSSLKEEFLKEWVKRLRMWGSSSREMTLMERTKAIKLSANLAMASAKNGASLWSRAIMASASKDNAGSSFLVQCPTANSCPKEGIGMERLTERTTRQSSRKSLHVRRKKMIMVRRGSRSKCIQRCRKHGVGAREVAQKLVEKRTRVLRGLVPGGESMDELDLLEETIDYMLSLRAQVHAMRTLANATQLL